jgi:hypothetical protein
MKRTNSPTDRLRQREQLTADVIDRVRQAIQEELAGAPQAINADDQEEINRTILDHTRRVVEALSIDEMGSEGALLSHIANARTETNRRIREHRPPTRVAVGPEKQQ